jgi:hypothetical protein
MESFGRFVSQHIPWFWTLLAWSVAVLALLAIASIPAYFILYPIATNVRRGVGFYLSRLSFRHATARESRRRAVEALIEDFRNNLGISYVSERVTRLEAVLASFSEMTKALSELDAAFFHLYLAAELNGDWRQPETESAEDFARLTSSFPKPRDAVAYIMDTFPIAKRRDEEKFNGDYRTKRVILEIYDAMAEAIRTGRPYRTRLDPPPADPSCRHPKKKIGILAFGSLIHDPGSELEPKIGMRIKTQTPFPVEYARYSAKRGGGPTLVPHEQGSPVSAEILVLDNDVDVGQARDLLWRRETNNLGSGKTYPGGSSANSVVVQEIADDPCVSTVLYTDFHAEGKVANPTPEELARRAIESVQEAKDGQDGISYLNNAIKCGIETRLTAAYRGEILRQMNASSLEDSLSKTKGR